MKIKPEIEHWLLFYLLREMLMSENYMLAKSYLVLFTFILSFQPADVNNKRRCGHHNIDNIKIINNNYVTTDESVSEVTERAASSLITQVF